MIVFGLTGGTGAGKSSASKELRRQGIYVADADMASRIVCEKGSNCLKELCRVFGEGILDDNGELKRRKLGEIVFSDRKKLECLTAITHRYIDEKIRKELASSGSPISAIDGAVIIGSIVEKQCSFIVSIIADRETRISRITSRDGISRESAEKRIDSQPGDDYYIKNSKYIIQNNGTEEELASQIEALITKIKESEFEQVI